MTTFDNREQAFENKFAHDAELQFKVDARSRNLLCLWVAHKLGKEGDEAVAYAKGMLMEWMKPGAPGVVERLMADIKTAALPVTEKEVSAKLAELQAQAKKQVMEES
jgi:hypothetical protein